MFNILIVKRDFCSEIFPISENSTNAGVFLIYENILVSECFQIIMSFREFYDFCDCFKILPVKKLLKFPMAKN